MTTASPTPPTLMRRWLCNDGSGSAVNESVNDYDMAITTYSSYPIWGDDYLTFGTRELSDCEQVQAGTVNPSCIDTDGITDDFSFAIKFRKQASTKSGLLMGFGWVNDGAWFTTDQGQFVLYVGTDEKLYFGCLTSNAASYPTYLSAASTATVTDGEWHEALCWITINSDADKHPIQGTLLLDGVSQGVFNSSDPNTIKSLNYKWRIGSGYLYYTGTTLHWPQTLYYGGDTNSNGSCEADLKDARVWCGIYTGEVTPANALMFSCNT